jgi:hypothetical protein
MPETEVSTEPAAETTTTSEPKPETQAAPEAPVAEAPATFSQSDLDKAVSKALKTNAKTLQAESKTQALRDSENFAELSKQLTTENQSLKDNAARSEFVAEHGLGDYKAIFEHIPVGGLEAVKDALISSRNADVLKQVSKQLDTPAPVTGAPAVPVSIDKMSKPEFDAYKKARNIQ